MLYVQMEHVTGQWRIAMTVGGLYVRKSPG